MGPLFQALVWSLLLVITVAYPSCDSRLKSFVIDFEIDRRGRRFREGDTPKRLPHRVIIGKTEKFSPRRGFFQLTTKRIGGRKKSNASGGNDVVVIDTSNKSTKVDGDFITYDDGKMVVLNGTYTDYRYRNETHVFSDKGGGYIFLRFEHPVYQVNEIRLLNTVGGGNVVAHLAEHTTEETRKRLSVPSYQGLFSVFPRDFFSVHRVRINLDGPGAVALLNVTECVSETDIEPDPYPEVSEPVTLPEDDLNEGKCPLGQELADSNTCQIKASWALVGHGLPGSSSSGKHSGQSSRLSDDGTTLVISDGVTTRVYRRDAFSILGWRQLGGDIDEVGTNVDVSADGNKIAVTGATAGCDTIQVYSYDGAEWMLVGDGGQSIYAQHVKISGDGSIIVAGSIDFGMVGAFLHVNGTWKMIGGYMEQYGSTYGDFGGYIDCAAGGTSFAVGYPGDGHDRGSVTVYEINKEKTAFSRLGSSVHGKEDGLRFGSVVALSADGKTLATTSGIPFGENFDGIGYVNVYRFDDVKGVWGKIGQTLSGLEGGEFGSSLALSHDGVTLAVGIPGYQEDSGMVKIFHLLGDIWTQVGEGLRGQVGSRFGAVSISGDGSMVGIGAPGTESKSGQVQVWRVSSVGG